LAHLLLIYNILFNKQHKSKNMDTNIPVPTGLPRGGPPLPFMPNLNPQMMPPMGGARPPFMAVPPQFANPIEANQKMSEFARGVYVSGFEKTLTVEMLQ
jgi:hypothetical protein